MKRENYVAPAVELIAIVEDLPICFIPASGEGSNVTTESMDDYYNI